MSCATRSDLVTFNVPLGIKSSDVLEVDETHKTLQVVKLLLVGGFKHECYFPFHIWDVILPIDENIFFRGVETANQTVLPCLAVLPVFVSFGLFVWVDHIYGTSVYYHPLSNENITDCWWWSRVVAQPSSR
jgi:hypothetical protein